MGAITAAVVAAVGVAVAAKGNQDAKKSAKKAREAQTAAGEAAIESQEGAELRATGLAQPFTQFGTSQLGPLQQALAPVSQEEEFAQLQSSPYFRRQ